MDDSSRSIDWCKREVARKEMRLFRWLRRRHRHHPKLIPVPIPVPSGITVTTLSEIMNGKFRSATDKHGANGILVRIPSLRVVSTKIEADGDTHVTVSDGKVKVFIAEITPVEKGIGIADPAPGQVITITGYPFYDKAHATEAWHGNTGWELHPVTGWR
jgi:hypothetical protein